MQDSRDGATRRSEQIDVSVVVVSYNVRSMLLRCLESVDVALAGVPHEVVVVDNASRDGSPTAVREGFPRARIIESPVNNGFGKANNLAIQQTIGEFVFFLNPDTQVDPAALKKLLDYIRARPNVGIAGPRLLYPTGVDQPSRRRFPTPLTAVVESTIVQQWLPRNALLDRYYLNDRSDVTQDVDWLVGACLLVRRSVLNLIGGFDERFFMYSEELDLCRRAREAGWRIAYVGDAEVTHYEGASSEQNLEQRSKLFNESKARYFEKYHGEAIGRALRLVLLTSTALDLGIEAGKLLLGHRAKLRRSRIASLARVAVHQAVRLRGQHQNAVYWDDGSARRPATIDKVRPQP
jgi:GT2 family glycosyltransferase